MGHTVANGLGTPLLSVLRCAGCRSASLQDRGTSLDCLECGRAFPVQAGIPVMAADAVPDRGPLLDPAVANAVMERLGIPPGPITMLRVRQASGARVSQRPNAPGRLLHDGQILADTAPARLMDVPVEGRLVCEWLAEYLPRAMPPGAELLANVQFRNAGRAVMPSAGDGRVTLAYEWGGPAGAATPADNRTPLPVDLLPGQVITLPVRLQTPVIPGPYTLMLKLVQEGVRWLEPVFGPFPVAVRHGAGFQAPPHWILNGPGPEDAEGDRARALGLLDRWIKQLGVARPHVLELSGGTRPVAAKAGYRSVNVDGDLMALQLGRLVPGVEVPALCADTADLPLAESEFHAAICVGALHDMADPARVLRNLRAHLRPGGFIGLFCEPVGHVWPGATPPATLAALRRGFNPQGFSIAEWAHIIHTARLRAVELVVDGASLKARLEPEAGNA